MMHPKFRDVQNKVLESMKYRKKSLKVRYDLSSTPHRFQPHRAH